MTAFVRRLACVAGWLAATAAAQAPTEVQGDLTGTVRWQGVVRVTGDVTVGDSARLEIAAGTKVWIAERDGLGKGWNKDWVEIHVRGQLLVEGNLDAPVVVARENAAESASAPPTAVQPSWHGIVLYASRDEAQNRDVVRGMRLEHAFAGLQIPGSSPLVEDCVFRGCEVGIEVGSAHKNGEFVGIQGGAASPEIRRSRFANGHTGIYAQSLAQPIVEFCVFHGLSTGVGPDRPVVVSRLDAPGTVVQNCAFVDCSCGVMGCSATRDSIFAGCRIALELSAYHDLLATDIDPIVFERCLVSGAGEEIVGDSAVARDVLRGEARFAGPIEDLAKPWPPLPTCLALQDGSAAIGVARNGGDLGPSAQPRPGAVARAMRWQGKVPNGWLAAAADAPGGWQKLAKATPGGACGKSWWAVADQEASGVFRLRRTFGLQRTTGLLALELTSASDAVLEFEFSGDTAMLEVVVNGKSALKVDQRRRFGGASVPVPLNLRSGANLVLVHVVGWGADPQVAFALGGDWQVSSPTAEAVVPTVKAVPARTKEGVFVDLTLSADVHWSAGPGKDLVKVQQVGRMDETVGLDGSWLSPRKLRVGPLPRDWGKVEVELQLSGARSLLGAGLVVPPVKVKLP